MVSSVRLVWASRNAKSTKADGTSANNAGFSNLKLGIARTHSTVLQMQGSPVAVEIARRSILARPYELPAMIGSLFRFDIGTSRIFSCRSSRRSLRPVRSLRRPHRRGYWLHRRDAKGLIMRYDLTDFERVIEPVVQKSLAALSFIVLPLPPRRAAVAGSRAYRKWRGATPLRGR